MKYEHFQVDSLKSFPKINSLKWDFYKKKLKILECNLNYSEHQ